MTRNVDINILKIGTLKHFLKGKCDHEVFRELHQIIFNDNDQAELETGFPNNNSIQRPESSVQSPAFNTWIQSPGISVCLLLLHELFHEFVLKICSGISSQDVLNAIRKRFYGDIYL